MTRREKRRKQRLFAHLSLWQAKTTIHSHGRFRDEADNDFEKEQNARYIRTGEARGSILLERGAQDLHLMMEKYSVKIE